MTHEQRIQLDMDLYDVAYELMSPDGSKQRIDPTRIREIKAKNREDRYFNKPDELKFKKEIFRWNTSLPPEQP